MGGADATRPPPHPASAMIPFANPRAGYRARAAEYDAAYHRVMDSGQYLLGPETAALEQAFAGWLGVPHAISVASGTEALWLALRAAGLGEGAEVLTPSLTAGATVAAIVQTGARPVFVEVDPHTLTLDPQGLPAALTPRTRAIVPVHLYGHPADLTGLAHFAAAQGLLMIEDCAQSHGAWHQGRRVGTFGTAAAWSFYPTKNMGAFGDGGLVTTPEAELAARVLALREYGWQTARYISAVHGWNSRLDELQAAFLNVRLAHLEADNARRRQIAARYRAELPARLPNVRGRPGDVTAAHLFVVRHPHRDALRAALAARGVGTGVHYPAPCHLQPAYAHLGRGAGSLPITELAAAEVLSLPLYPELTEAEVGQVIAACHAALAELG